MFEKLFLKNSAPVEQVLSRLETPEQWLIEAIGRPKAADNLASNISAVQRCLAVRANTISKLPIQVFRRAGGGRERIRDPSVVDLLEKRPNKTTTPSQLKKMISVDIDTWGNAYVLIEGNREALRRLEPWLVDVALMDDRSLTYTYADPVSGGRVTYTYLQVMHFKELGNNSYKGRSKIENARLTISNDYNANALLEKYYERGTLSNAILMSPNDLNGEVKNKIREEWIKHNSGVQKAFDIPVLDRSLEYKEISMSFADAQFLAMRKFSVEEIGRFFNIPPHKLGIMDGAKFNNVQSQNEDFIGNEIQPLLTDIEEEMDFKYFYIREKREGLFTRFNMEAALRAAPEARSNYYEKMRNLGAINVNEIRGKEDMDGIGEDGDIYWGNLNFVPMDIIREYQLKNKGGEQNGKNAEPEDE
ncbi:MAG: phage portal protein [Eubacterium aggregans]|uniref:phage portal protein n=1 Tax=Eubacterium aggregans TaxID=81409 RepID=UPI002B211550|nr:phage portal protein [Eubacterium aggregans]MEA5073087.1 phage portal protein [Eubacterium aggregans]